MTRQLTDREIQRVSFVEALHSSLKKQGSEALHDQDKFVTLASSYKSDGLEDSECVELLMIDGLQRETAESYMSMVKSEVSTPDGLFEYTFQFEDASGKRWSSYDIDRTVKASNDEEAWGRAEELIDQERSMEPGKVISIARIS